MTKKKVVILIIMILIYISIPVIIYTIYKVNRNREIKDIEEKEKNTLNLAKKKAKAYLKETYNKDFKIKLESNGYKSNEFSIDGSYFECGHDEDILEFVFYVYADDLDVPFFVTVWMDKEKRDIEVIEVKGSSSNRDSSSYDNYKKYEEDKKLIKDELNSILLTNYQSYSIDDKSQANTIIITINDYLYNEYNKDTINKLINILNNKSINIKLIYNDTIRYYDNYTNINTEKDYINFYHDIYYYLKNNLNDKYEIIFYSSNIELKINTNIKINYNEYYEKIYSDLLELCLKYNEHIDIKFNDDIIYISEYHENKTLKELINH